MIKRSAVIVSCLLLSTTAWANTVWITASGQGGSQTQARIAAEFNAQLQCHKLGMGTLQIHFSSFSPHAGGWQAEVTAECGKADGPPDIYH
jgi:hypothetical protein